MPDVLLDVLLDVREAGRRAVVRLVGFFFVLRDRVLEARPFEAGDLDVDVLVLRDPGGEDVRVAMVTPLGDRHTGHRD